MALQQMQVLVNGLDQSGLLGQSMHGANAPLGNTFISSVHFVLDIRTLEHGAGLVFPVPTFQPFLDFFRAAIQVFMV